MHIPFAGAHVYFPSGFLPQSHYLCRIAYCLCIAMKYPYASR